MKKIIVRYKIKPGYVAQNESLIKEVYKQLHSSKIDGFHYATFKLEDGASFVHIAIFTEEANEAFKNLPAFKSFQGTIKERCDELPVTTLVTEIGSYDFTLTTN